MSERGATGAIRQGRGAGRLVLLGVLALLSAGAQPGPSPAVVVHLGDSSDHGDRFRARLLAHDLAFYLGEEAVSLHSTEALHLEFVSGVAPIDPERPLEPQVERLRRLRAPAPDGSRLPADLASLEARFPERDLRCETLTDSWAKPQPRRICRDDAGQVSIAETLRDDGTVRETEVALARPGAPERWDFLVYDEAGRRSFTSDFGTDDAPRILPAPQSCAACHYDDAAGSFRRRPLWADPSRVARLDSSRSGERFLLPPEPNP